MLNLKIVKLKICGLSYWLNGWTKWFWLLIGLTLLSNPDTPLVKTKRLWLLIGCSEAGYLPITADIINARKQTSGVHGKSQDSWH